MGPAVRGLGPLPSAGVSRSRVPHEQAGREGCRAGSEDSCPSKEEPGLTTQVPGEWAVMGGQEDQLGWYSLSDPQTPAQWSGLQALGLRPESRWCGPSQKLCEDLGDAVMRCLCPLVSHWCLSV